MTSKEAVNKLYYYIEFESDIIDSLRKQIYQELERLEKLEKVIEILKDYLMIKVSINRNNEYCLDACDYAIPYLNKEQYDLLKEYLDDK